MPIAAIAWDIDGTLIDSEPLHHRALLEGSRRMGADLSSTSAEFFRGAHIHHIWKRVQPKLAAGTHMSEWQAAMNRVYEENVLDLMPIGGAIDILAEMNGLGLTQCCVSNAGRRVVDVNLTRLAIADQIAFSLSINDVARGKPDPELYLTAAERLGVPPGQVLAVEDSVAGALAARAAGMIVVGFHPSRFDFADVDHLVGELSEISTIVRKRL